MCCYGKYGSTFGGGYDLCIVDNAALGSKLIRF